MVRVARRHALRLAMVAFGVSTHAVATDWPRFRGYDLSGISPDPILQSWPTNGLPIAWQVSSPGGYSASAVAGGKVFTLRNTTSECCVALDAGSGTQHWATALGPAVSYSTPTVKDGFVYVYSGTHKLFCLNVTNGGIVWQRDLTNEFGATTIEYGNSQSPWVEDGRVLVSVQAATNCLLAFNATNGALLWRGHTNAVTYGSPVGVTICGVPQVIFPDPHGLVSIAPEDGRLLWRLARGYSPGRHGPSPVVSGDNVVCVKSDNSGGEVFQVLQTDGVFSTKTLWTNATLTGTYVTLVVHENHLYGAFNNALQCLDLANGQLKWRTNLPFSPSVILAGKKLLILGQDGSLALATASPLRYEELARCKLPGSDYENSPAFSDGRIYVRCPSRMLCLDASVPAPLEISTAPLPGGTQLRLTVRCKNGSPIPTDRASRVYIRWSPTLAPPPGQWPVWSGPLVYTNGVLCGDASLLRGEPARYFIAVEATDSAPLEVSTAPLPSGTQLRLTVRCKDGSPIPIDRAPRIHIAWNPSLELPPGQWPTWPGQLVYTNGVLHGDLPLLRNQSARYFIAVEE